MKIGIMMKYFDLHKMIGNGLQVDESFETCENPV